jgi:hypothetical protein
MIARMAELTAVTHCQYGLSTLDTTAYVRHHHMSVKTEFVYVHRVTYIWIGVIVSCAGYTCSTKKEG